MSTRTAALAVDVVSDVAKAVAGLDDVGDASHGASTGVADMGREAQDSARKLNITADSADELGGKAGKATGALGALSSGFELVGAEKYAGALQGASLATDFFSGVGDSLNLVMESTIVKTARARVTAIAHGIATKASAVATGVMTGAQWLLNAAMSANPILLVVIALAALVAGLVIAYKHSETFRRIVAGALNAVESAASSVFNWLKRNWPLLLAILTGPFGLAILVIAKHWDSIKDGVTNAFKNVGRLLLNAGKNVIGGFISGIESMAGTLISAIKRTVTDALPGFVKKALGIHSPSRVFRTLGQQTAQGLIDGIESSIPELRSTLTKVTDTVANIQPNLNGSLSVSAGGTAGDTATIESAAATARTVIQVNVTGALDPDAVARQIVQLLVRLARSLGIPVAQLLGGTA